MSNLILNLRFGEYHLQIVRFSDWRHQPPIRISHNPYHAQARKEAGWKWFEWC